MLSKFSECHAGTGVAGRTEFALSLNESAE